MRARQHWRHGTRLAAILLFSAFSSWLQAGPPPAPPSMLAAHVDLERGHLEWSHRGQKLLVYSFVTNQFKPYVRELVTLTGEDVLRDAPADHLHHHGLMYAIRVNDVNFWEETGSPGHERHVKFLKHDTGMNRQGLPQASFTELLHWVPHGDHARADTAPAALLVERRTLMLTVDETREEVSLVWHAEFEVGARTDAVRLHGSNYNGLGLRLPSTWDQIASHVNSGPNRLINGGQAQVSPARWSAVARTSESDAPQVVLCAPTDGQAGANLFFTMTEPFTYLSVTQGLDITPLDYHAGDRFTLDYLILVYPSARTPAQIEKRYLAWERSRP